DRLNPALAAETFPNLDEATRDKLRTLPSNDQVLAEALQRSRVVLGESGGPEARADLDRTLPKTGIATRGQDAERFMWNFPGLLRNVSVIEH
ncbi:MAG: adenylate/guanylate cyclase domain-containing protein, partial [Bradyrhizobium sp.]